MACNLEIALKSLMAQDQSVIQIHADSLSIAKNVKKISDKTRQDAIIKFRKLAKARLVKERRSMTV